MIKTTIMLFLLIYTPLVAKANSNNDHNQTKVKRDKLYKIQKELGLIKPKPKPKLIEKKVLPKVEKPSTKKTKVLSQSDKEKAEKIRKELGITTPTKKESKLDKIRKELGIEYEIPKKKDKIIDKIDEIKKKLDIDIDFNMGKTIRKIEKSLDLSPKKKSSWNVPDIFNFASTKKEKPILGLSILQDVKDSTSTMYNTAKYSGESAELMSGAVYYNAKVYNTMFDLFDKSPFNIFEDKKSDSGSLFGLFD